MRNSGGLSGENNLFADVRIIFDDYFGRSFGGKCDILEKSNK